MPLPRPRDIDRRGYRNSVAVSVARLVTEGVARAWSHRGWHVTEAENEVPGLLRARRADDDSVIAILGRSKSDPSMAATTAVVVEEPPDESRPGDDQAVQK